MRISLASPLESRDGTLTKGGLVKNGIVEPVADGVPARLRKRPGVATYGTATSKLALLYANQRATSTDLVSEVALGDPSYATVYGIFVAEGASTTGFVKYRTWNGSAWAGSGSGSYSGTGTTVAFGCAQLDGFFLAMTITGKIIQSAAINDPSSSWPAADYISLAADGGTPSAMCRFGDYIIGFSTTSMQPFYNAGNPTGSILAKVNGGIAPVGCVAGRSIAQSKGAMFWLGRERQLGAGVYMMQGLAPQRISTPAVDRIIAADDFATVYGTCCTAGGADLYLLTLGTTGITLVYNIKNGDWSVWTGLTAGSNKSVSSITRSGTTATVTTAVSHTLNDGDAVTMAGADQSDYNGIFQGRYVSATVFTIEVANSPTTPATGTITATPFTESYFPYVRYVGEEGAGAMLPTTGTTWHKYSDTTYRDTTTLPVNFIGRTVRLDGGTDDRKKMTSIGVVGNSVSDTAMVRWSDDDYATNNAYRIVTLSDEQPELRRCGAFHRRSIEFRHIGNTAPVIDALELDVTK